MKIQLKHKNFLFVLIYLLSNVFLFLLKELIRQCSKMVKIFENFITFFNQ